MATKNKDMKWVVSGFIAVSLLIFGSIVVEHNMIDIIYFTILICYFIRYILLKVKS